MARKLSQFRSGFYDLGLKVVHFPGTRVFRIPLKASVVSAL